MKMTDSMFFFLFFILPGKVAILAAGIAIYDYLFTVNRTTKLPESRQENEGIT